MNMLYRGMMNSLIRMAEIVPECVESIHPDKEMKIYELMEYDFIGFFLYLITADHVISDAELEFINSCYPKAQTREEWMEIAQENKWIREDYLTELPACWPLFIEADNYLFDTGSDKAGTLTTAFYETFENLGDLICICEGDLNKTTGIALNDFQYMIRCYMERHAKWI